MKKLLLISILLGSVILAGCGQKQGISQDELFSKKQECTKYKDGLQNRIDKDIMEVSSNPKNFYSENIEEIFYSKKGNSCFAVTKVISNFNGLKYSYFQIIDLLSSDMTNYNTTDANNMIYYSERLKELKGE